MSEIAENELGFKSVDFTDLKNLLSRTCRGKKNGGTWMHPVLFIKFAMWLSPRFEYHVLKFVADEMIKYRNDAGDAYKALSTAISGLVSRDFMPAAMSKVAEALNWIVFNEHHNGARNTHGEENKQRELFLLENKITDLINEGFITSFKQLEGYLGTLWRNKWSPRVLKETFLND